MACVQPGDLRLQCSARWSAVETITIAAATKLMPARISLQTVKYDRRCAIGGHPEAFKTFVRDGRMMCALGVIVHERDPSNMYSKSLLQGMISIDRLFLLHAFCL